MTREESSSPAGDFGIVLTALLQHGVDFVLCGGVACILHGVSRVTADVDLCVAMAPDNLQQLLAAARKLGLRPRIPEPSEALLDEEKRREWVEEKNAVVFTFVDPNGPLQVDVFLTYPIPYYELRAGAEEFPLDQHTLLLSSKEHLIRAKQAVRPQRKADLRDIEDLTALLDHESR